MIRHHLLRASSVEDRASELEELFTAAIAKGMTSHSAVALMRENILERTSSLATRPKSCEDDYLTTLYLEMWRERLKTRHSWRPDSEYSVSYEYTRVAYSD